MKVQNITDIEGFFKVVKYYFDSFINTVTSIIHISSLYTFTFNYTVV